MSERLEEIKEHLALCMDQGFLFTEQEEKLLEVLYERAEQVEDMQKLVNYHQQKQKEAEDANEPYRHQNKRYREAIEKALAECVKDRPITAEKILAKALESESE